MPAKAGTGVWCRLQGPLGSDPTIAELPLHPPKLLSHLDHGHEVARTVLAVRAGRGAAQDEAAGAGCFEAFGREGSDLVSGTLVDDLHVVKIADDAGASPKHLGCLSEIYVAPGGSFQWVEEVDAGRGQVGQETGDRAVVVVVGNAAVLMDDVDQLRVRLAQQRWHG